MKSLSYLNNTSVLIIVQIYYSATTASTYLNFKVSLWMDWFLLSNL